MADDDTVEQFSIPGMEQPVLPGMPPRRKRTCAICKCAVKLYRCQNCFRLVCDDDGAENQDGDWFCDKCWAEDAS